MSVPQSSLTVYPVGNYRRDDRWGCPSRRPATPARCRQAAATIRPRPPPLLLLAHPVTLPLCSFGAKAAKYEKDSNLQQRMERLKEK